MRPRRSISLSRKPDFMDFHSQTVISNGALRATAKDFSHAINFVSLPTPIFRSTVIPWSVLTRDKKMSGDTGQGTHDPSQVLPDSVHFDGQVALYRHRAEEFERSFYSLRTMEWLLVF